MGFAMKIPLLAPRDYRFPDPSYALDECDGLVGVSGDLDTGRLLSAYGQGIFRGLAAMVGFSGMRLRREP